MTSFVPVFDIGFLLIVLVIARYALATPWAEPWTKSLGAAQTLLTVLGIVVAASWFIIEQPHANRLKMDISAQGAPGPPGQVMVVAEVNLSNLGVTVMNLKDGTMDLFVQQVTPTPPEVAAEAGRRDSQGALIIQRGERWGTLAEVTDRLRFFLESGESESLYYRVALPCQPGLRVVFGAWLTRPAMPADVLFGVKDYQFRKQTLVNLADLCSTARRTTDATT